MIDRRTFLELAAASGAAALWPASESRASVPAGASAHKPRSILVLGGTNFVGPAVVERARERGHEVTLFNRGITRPELFPGLEKLRGERGARSSILTALGRTRRWDAVIDTWPEQSALVGHTAEALADRTDYYFFVSSIAVYRDFSRPGLDESAAIHRDDPGWYGGEKVLAEELVASRFADRSGIARCHAIVGPRDTGAAFHYWLRRLATRSEVLAPGSGDDPLQLLDVRDLGAWIVDCIEQRRSGVHNLCGPPETPTLRQVLETCREALDSDARLTWVDADFLRRDHGVQSFTDLPLWAPLDEDAGFYGVDGRKAARAGAVFRPLALTARDAWLWFRSHFFKDTAFPVGGLGLAPDREAELLEAWRAHG